MSFAATNHTRYYSAAIFYGCGWGGPQSVEESRGSLEDLLKVVRSDSKVPPKRSDRRVRLDFKQKKWTTRTQKTPREPKQVHQNQAARKRTRSSYRRE